MYSSAPQLAALCCTLSILVCFCSLQTVVVAESKPKSIHLTYYVHEVQYGANRTLLPAAGTGQGNVAEIGWGSFLVFEHPLRKGTTADSKLIGKTTGTAVVSTIGGFATGGFRLNAEHIFTEGSEYHGSSLIVTGTGGYPREGWEQIVPGGTGYFRGYSGYGLGKKVDAASKPPKNVWQWDIYLSKCQCCARSEIEFSS